MGMMESPHVLILSHDSAREGEFGSNDLCGGAGHFPDGNDAVAANRHLAAPPRIARAVNNARITEEKVEGGGSGLRTAQSQADGARQQD